MNDKAIDDSIFERRDFKMEVTEGRGRVRRVNGETLIEGLRKYKKKYGEEEYVKMLRETGIENPKCIKLRTKAEV